MGSVTTAIVGEQLGRRKTIGAGVIVMIIGALLQATAYTRAHMIVARIVSGFGMGAINSTVPVMQAEFSPKASRGICMSALTYSLCFSNLCRCMRSIVYAQLWHFLLLLD